MGNRTSPDNNDIVVWKFDDAGAPFVNSSTSTNSLGVVANLTDVSGTYMTQQPSLFAPYGENSCIYFTGNNSGSPRNYVSGANTVEPQAPLTISGWVFIRPINPTGFNQHLITKQTTIGVWSGGTFSDITFQTGSSSGQSTTLFMNMGSAGVTLPPANQWVQGKWCHLGMTYDGSVVNFYMDGTLYGATPLTGSISYGNGPWFFGAIPSGSGNPEETSGSICDVRIANVVRPLSYFQNIFNSGIAPYAGGSGATTYYKLRAYDLSCATPTPVYWVSTTANLNSAPNGPCGSNFSEVEILESWSVIG